MRKFEFSSINDPIADHMGIPDCCKTCPAMKVLINDIEDIEEAKYELYNDALGISEDSEESCSIIIQVEPQNHASTVDIPPIEQVRQQMRKGIIEFTEKQIEEYNDTIDELEHRARVVSYGCNGPISLRVKRRGEMTLNICKSPALAKGNSDLEAVEVHRR